MSVQAMSWAIEQRRVMDPTARHLLLCMANYADKHGRNVWASATTLAEDTGLSERSVRMKRQLLEEIGVIRRGNQAVVAAEVSRVDRRPVNYDLDMGGGLHLVHPAEQRAHAGNGVHVVHPDGVQLVHPEEGTGCTSFRDGVHHVPPRGARGAPKPSFNRQGTDTHIGGPAPRDYEGAFEGHGEPATHSSVGGTAAGAAARLLRELGYRVTSQDPNLIAAVGEGVTLEQLREFAEVYPPTHPKCTGGSAGYVVAAARSQRAQPANVVSIGGSHGNSIARSSARPSRSEEIAAAGRALDELEAERERNGGR